MWVRWGGGARRVVVAHAQLRLVVWGRARYISADTDFLNITAGKKPLISGVTERQLYQLHQSPALGVCV